MRILSTHKEFGRRQELKDKRKKMMRNRKRERERVEWGVRDGCGGG